MRVHSRESYLRNKYLSPQACQPAWNILIPLLISYISKASLSQWIFTAMSLRLSHSASKALTTQCGRRDLVVRAPYLTRSIITCSLQEGQVLRPRSSNTPKTFGIRNKKQQPRCNSLSTSMSFSSNAILHQAKTVDYLLADVGEGITECEIVKW